MHYQVNGMQIRSENTAKPMINAAKSLVKWLMEKPRIESSLDYGCGKLRYTPYLAANSQCLSITDSTEQLDRTQRIDGEMTSVRQYAGDRWPCCNIYELTQFWEGIPHVYDFILCANVLSAIPSAEVRECSLLSLQKSLAQDGTLLVVNQHTNSYFREVMQKPETVPYLDGWILPSRKGNAYYGILTKDKTIELMKQYGFAILDAWIDGQSNFVLVNKGKL